MEPTTAPTRPAEGEGVQGWPRPLTHDLAYLRTGIVNVYFSGVPNAGDRNWVLIDAGMPGSTRSIVEAAERRFGVGARAAAIVLTHGHFDHVGALEELVRAWEVPVYAHPLEHPYLDGRSPYPPPDPSVGGGLMAALSWMYPRGPVNVADHLHALPEDGTVNGLPGWRWVHTPGHTPGHVSLFREADRALIAGDAFITVKQESALAVMAQRPEIHGPPAYYTTDWLAAGNSVRELAALDPLIGATGHGVPLLGDELRTGLRRLAADFERLAVPSQGRYVGHPAIADATGVVAVPPDNASPLPRFLLGLGVGVAAGLAIGAMVGGPRRRG